MDTIRCFLTDDHAMIRGGLAHTLEAADGITVVGEAEDGTTALAEILRLGPDVILLDYSLPDMDGTQLIGNLRKEGCAARVIMLTMHDTPRHAKAAIDAGADGFLLKADDLADLATAIRIVHAGGRFISNSVEDGLDKLNATPKRKRQGLESLSPRELELLRRLGEGLTLQQASAAMGDISESTASTYRARLMKKLGLENTAQIIRFALENEVVS